KRTHERTTRSYPQRSGYPEVVRSHTGQRWSHRPAHELPYELREPHRRRNVGRGQRLTGDYRHEDGKRPLPEGRQKAYHHHLLYRSVYQRQAYGREGGYEGEGYERGLPAHPVGDSRFHKAPDEGPEAPTTHDEPH